MSDIFNTSTGRPSYTCAVCNAEWTSKKKEGLPKRCPRCKSKLWNTCYRHSCCKCGYGWQSASSMPDRCPKCQSKKWYDENNASVPSANNSSNKSIGKPVLLRYDAGLGCIKIAADLGITFSEVYDVVKGTYPDQEPRL